MSVLLCWRGNHDTDCRFVLLRAFRKAQGDGVLKCGCTVIGKVRSMDFIGRECKHVREEIHGPITVLVLTLS